MELRARLGQILDRASAGEHITVARDGHPVAALVSYEEGLRLEGSLAENLARSLAALDRLDGFRERMAVEHPKTLDGPDAATAVRLERGRDDPSRS